MKTSWAKKCLPILDKVALAGCVAFAAHAAAANDTALPPLKHLAESPWNGDWTLSPTLNPKDIQDAAAPGYRFHLDHDGHIRWEIPALHEIVEGRMNGDPMVIRRRGSSGLTLSVTALGERVLLYRVGRNGITEGEGRMTLVDQDKVWVDISQPAGRPDLAGAVVYVQAKER